MQLIGRGYVVATGATIDSMAEGIMPHIFFVTEWCER